MSFAFCSMCLVAQSCLFATLWTVAQQAPRSMGFSRQEYWNELPCPSPRDLPNPRIEPRSPSLQEDSLPAELPGKPIAMLFEILQYKCISIIFQLSKEEKFTEVGTLVLGDVLFT